MNTVRRSMRASLLGLALALPVQAQDPLGADRAPDLWLGQAIAAQGNRALLQIREELRLSLRKQTPPLPQFAAAGVAAEIARVDAAVHPTNQ